MAEKPRTLETEIGREFKTLSSVRCPRCNSRMRHTARRRYYCGHCKKRWRVQIKVIQTEIVEDK